MPKEVVITTDSTCDIPGYILKERKVAAITPLTIQLGTESYLDGVNITPDDIYSYYNKTKTLPKTAAVSPMDYAEVFKKFVDQGKAVVHINLSSAVSSTHQNAMLVASEMEDVYVIDSKNLFAGMGLLVLKACDLRDEGKSANEIANEIERIRPEVSTTFVLDTLEFLHKGGRCSSLARLGANLLSLKPSIEVDPTNGSMSVSKKYRGKIDAVYRQYANDRLKDTDKIDKTRIVIGHSGVSQSTIDELKDIVSKSGMFKEVIVSRAGCTITSHCGPNTVAIIYINK